MGKHTPGPWHVRNVTHAGLEVAAEVGRIEQFRGRDGNLPVWYIPRDVYGTYGVVPGDKPQPLIGCEPWVQFPPKWWIEMGEANARLISAAPELLSACLAMLECTGGSDHWQGETHEALKLIEAAVKKAVEAPVETSPVAAAR